MKARTMKWTASAIAITAGCGMATSAFANQDVMDHIAAGDVVQPNITYDGHNHSPFDQINTSNVADLTIAWTLQLGVLDQYEASPMVVGDTMYVVAPVNQSEGSGQAPNVLMALDLNNNGKILWEFRPDVDREHGLQACCGQQTRGMQYAEGNVYYTTIDGQVFALDGETGEALWRSVAADVTIREENAGNGIIINDLYIVGNQGGEYGVRGKVQAFDIHTGQTQWTMYNMGPDNEVGIGPRFNPYYADDQQGSLSTWYGDSWRRGGGTVWGYFSYDPDSNQFFYSSGNCGPWNPDYRREWGVVNLDENGGLIDYRNNWCASQLSRDATTGELIWAYNITPADNWDFDEPLNTTLADMDVNGDGTVDHVAMKAARTGWFYIWDRSNGQILNEPWPFVYTNFMTGVDLTTGRPSYDITRWTFTNAEDRQRYTDYEMPGAADRGADFTGTEVEICPYINARNWQNDSFDQGLGLYYVSTSNRCGTEIVLEGEYVAGEGYTLRQSAGANPIGAYREPDRHSPDFGQPGDVQGNLDAIDPLTNEIVWTVPFTVNNQVPVMTTAGGLLFESGSNDGTVNAYDSATGERLWSFVTGSQGSASPIAYMHNGNQYIAFVESSRSTSQVNVDDAADAGARYARAGSTLYIFALPEAVAGR